MGEHGEQDEEVSQRNEREDQYTEQGGRGPAGDSRGGEESDSDDNEREHYANAEHGGRHIRVLHEAAQRDEQRCYQIAADRHALTRELDAAGPVDDEVREHAAADIAAKGVRSVAVLGKFPTEKGLRAARPEFLLDSLAELPAILDRLGE